MAHRAPQRPPSHHNLGVLHWFLCLCCRLYTAHHHPRDTASAYVALPCRHLQLDVSDVPGYRYLPHFVVCEVRGEGQYIARYYPYTIRHILQAVATEGPQLLDIGPCVCHHHRLRWFGRCRGAYCAYRFGYRLKPRSAVPYGQQDPHAARWLWCRRRYRRHLQGSDSRTGVHP